MIWEDSCIDIIPKVCDVEELFTWLPDKYSHSKKTAQRWSLKRGKKEKKQCLYVKSKYCLAEMHQWLAMQFTKKKKKLDRELFLCTSFTRPCIDSLAKPFFFFFSPRDGKKTRVAFKLHKYNNLCHPICPCSAGQRSLRTCNFHTMRFDEQGNISFLSTDPPPLITVCINQFLNDLKHHGQTKDRDGE